MGGKSTYLRTACTTVIMAQLGCFVPASSCRLTPVDRIFTRVGASDRILAAQSTFFVELAETSAILSQASKHSLVILDELGRGTSTFDGNAIAYAVTRHLTKNVGCRTLFATHYHTLCDDFGKDRDVELGHMACVVEEHKNSASAADTEMDELKKSGHGKSTSDASVTFLYTYQHGACPKSYGLNVARLARLPEGVIQRAKEKSEEFETAVESLRLQSSLLKRARLALNDERGDAALDEYLNSMV
jgi:DNA mismatch repair protein MSH6